MNKREIIERLKNIAGHAVHTAGKEPFIMSIDDGIAVHEAIELLELPSAQLEQRWIPVTEKLPKIEEAVLVSDGKLVWKDWRHGNGHWFFSSDFEGTAWMPLPEPCKGD